MNSEQVGLQCQGSPRYCLTAERRPRQGHGNVALCRALRWLDQRSAEAVIRYARPRASNPL